MAARTSSHHHLVLSNPFANARADEDDSSFDDSIPSTPTTANPTSGGSGGLRAQLHHLLPRHAFFHVLIIVHQITNIPLVSGEFAVKWKFKNVHSAPGVKKTAGLLDIVKARRKKAQEKNEKGKGKAADEHGVDDADETHSLASSERKGSMDGRAASLWSGKSSSSSSSSSSSHTGISSTVVNPSTRSSPSLASTTTASTAPSLPGSVLPAPVLASAPAATTPGSGQTPFLKLKDHKVSWEYSLSILIRMDVDRDPQSMLLSCPVKLTILQRDPANPEARPTRFGVVPLDLAQYACKGEVGRRYLLRESKTNATLKLTTHLTHLPTTTTSCTPSSSASSTPSTSSSASTTTSSTSATTTSNSTNTFTAPPLPKGEILSGISNILNGPASLGIIGEHDVYRVRPKGLDLYGPYYDQEELELDLLGGRAPKAKSKSKSKSKRAGADEAKDKEEKEQVDREHGKKTGRERSATQSFDPSRLPLAYGPKTTETLIEALFNPVHTTHRARESPFTVYVPSASSPAATPASNTMTPKPTPMGPNTPNPHPTPHPPTSPPTSYIDTSPPTSPRRAPRPALSPNQKPKPKPVSAGIGAGLGIMGLGIGLGLGMGVGVGVGDGGEGERRGSVDVDEEGRRGRASVDAGGRRSVDTGTGRRGGVDMERRAMGAGGEEVDVKGGGGVKGWLRKRTAGVGAGSSNSRGAAVAGMAR